jgi:excisionase family DNA binding protein
MDEAFGNRIWEAIATLRKEIMVANGNGEILSFQEALAFLRLPEGTLREFVRLRRIPYHKIGRRIFFRRRELDLWFDKHMVRPR